MPTPRITNSKKTPNPSNPLSPTSRRNRHREEAELRKMLRDGRPIGSQMRLIAGRPGKSAREVARLTRKAV
jgi:hypothetical protein